MIKFLSVKCFLNLLQLHLAMPFPFLIKCIHIDIAILPPSIDGSSDMIQFFLTIPYILTSPGIVHLMSLCSCFSSKIYLTSVTQWSNREGMGPVLRQPWCQCYPQMITNLKWKGIYSICATLKHSSWLIYGCDFCPVHLPDHSFTWFMVSEKAELCLLYCWEAKPGEIRLTQPMMVTALLRNNWLATIYEHPGDPIFWLRTFYNSKRHQKHLLIYNYCFTDMCC